MHDDQEALVTWRSTFWWGAAAIYMLINLAGAGYAAALGEGTHAAVHVVLLAVGAIVIGGFARRAGREDLLITQPGHRGLASAQPTDARLEQLQQSVDAVALEVERLGEAQRFHAKLEAERARKR